MTTSVDGGGTTPPAATEVVTDGGAVPTGSLSWTQDVDQVWRGALQLQRITDADADADRLYQLAEAATALCDRYLDRPVTYLAGAVPAPVLQAAVTVTVELYKRKDAPFGITGAWSPDGGAMRVSRDVLAGVEALLAPYRGGWGIA